MRDEANARMVSTWNPRHFWSATSPTPRSRCGYGAGRRRIVVDIGSGAGSPGIVIACLVEGPVALVEPRWLRADFFHKVVGALGLRLRSWA